MKPIGSQLVIIHWFKDGKSVRAMDAKRMVYYALRTNTWYVNWDSKKVEVRRNPTNHRIFHLDIHETTTGKKSDNVVPIR